METNNRTLFYRYDIRGCPLARMRNAQKRFPHKRLPPSVHQGIFIAPSTAVGIRRQVTAPDKIAIPNGAGDLLCLDMDQMNRFNLKLNNQTLNVFQLSDNPFSSVFGSFLYGIFRKTIIHGIGLPEQIQNQKIKHFLLTQPTYAHCCTA